MYIQCQYERTSYWHMLKWNYDENQVVSIVTENDRRHFIALEIFDGHLYFVWSGIGAKR